MPPSALRAALGDTRSTAPTLPTKTSCTSSAGLRSLTSRNSQSGGAPPCSATTRASPRRKPEWRPVVPGARASPRGRRRVPLPGHRCWCNEWCRGASAQAWRTGSRAARTCRSSKASFSRAPSASENEGQQELLVRPSSVLARNPPAPEPGLRPSVSSRPWNRPDWSRPQGWFWSHEGQEPHPSRRSRVGSSTTIRFVLLTPVGTSRHRLGRDPIIGGGLTC